MKVHSILALLGSVSGRLSRGIGLVVIGAITTGSCSRGTIDVEIRAGDVPDDIWVVILADDVQVAELRPSESDRSLEYVVTAWPARNKRYALPRLVARTLRPCGWETEVLTDGFEFERRPRFNLLDKTLDSLDLRWNKGLYNSVLRFSLWVDNRGGGPVMIGVGEVTYSVVADVLTTLEVLAPTCAEGVEVALDRQPIGRLPAISEEAGNLRVDWVVDTSGQRCYSYTQVAYGLAPRWDSSAHYARKQRLWSAGFGLDYFGEAPERISHPGPGSVRGLLREISCD